MDFLINLWIQTFIFWIICGIAAGVIGSKKGVAFHGFVLGFFLGPIGIVIALVMKGDRKKCPKCQEYVDKNALKCPKCQAELSQTSIPMIINGEINVDNEIKKCPACAEQIKLEAIKCRYCGYDFDPGVVEEEIKERKKELERKYKNDAFVSQEGTEGEAYCIGCNNTDTRSLMLYNKKTDTFYHKKCLPKLP